MRLLLTSMLACIVGLSGALFYIVTNPPDPAVLKSTIAYYQHVDLAVGDSRTIHGRRGSCGKAAPSWDAIKHELPPMKTGTWSDGAVGLRYSRNCASVTPARGVTFTATAVGTEQINLYGDDMTIRVSERR